MRIFKIEEIIEKNLEINIKGKFVANTQPYFEKPFSSSNLRIFCSYNELLKEELKVFLVEAINSKVMALKTNC